MVTSVPRHAYPTDEVPDTLDALSETADWILEEFPDSPVLRPQALSTALTLAQQHCALDPRAVRFEAWQAWVTGMRTGSALFAAATAPEGTRVTCRIKERERTLPATGIESHLNAGTWVTSFYLAMICRDNDRLRRLAEVPVSFLRQAGALFDEYVYDWAEALRSFWLGRQDVGDQLVAAVDGTAPEARHLADADLMSHILRPPLLMLYRILRRDPDEFGKTRTDALRLHKEYWTADEGRATSADGLVALGPLALTCLARDQGLPVNVESEYLPKALLEYSWSGEIEY
ncbi:immunity 49 family protein [Streptomyces griseoaurantiacus]|uniref:immunity 49 family protein n=1 Tax=Streptomyces griseoaurantiacus TaxID=68213 RepID=UPI002E285992|nr:immunity 49 family protein [Streptomyces jietaisiensis]